MSFEFRTDEKKVHRLSEDEIQKINKTLGKDLNQEGFYVLRFLYNDKMNQAADPKPFKVSTKSLDLIAKKFVGMPWIIPPKLQNKPQHLRGQNERGEDSAKALLEKQNKYSVGPAVATIRNPDSNNVYAVYSIWPEYQKAISENRSPFDEDDELSPYTSITLGNPLFGDKTETEVVDAQPINLQTVGTPGYTPQLAKVQGVCQKGLQHCMKELEVIASAGKLDDKRQEESFIKTIGAAGMSMSEQTNEGSSGEPSIGEIKTAVEQVQKDVVEVKDMGKKTQEVLVKVATEADGVDETKIKKELGAEDESGDDSDENEDDSGAIGAAGKQALDQVKAVKSELKDIKSELAKYKQRDEEQAIALRKKDAETIVDKLFPKLTGDDKTKKVTEYVDLKDENGKPRDIEILANHVKDKKSEVFGAAGYPDFTVDEGDSSGHGQHLLRRMTQN